MNVLFVFLWHVFGACAPYFSITCTHYQASLAAVTEEVSQSSGCLAVQQHAAGQLQVECTALAEAIKRKVCQCLHTVAVYVGRTRTEASTVS